QIWPLPGRGHALEGVSRHGRAAPVCGPPARGREDGAAVRRVRHFAEDRGERLWLVTFMQYDLDYFDDETCRLEPIENPFGPKVLPMSSEGRAAAAAQPATP